MALPGNINGKQMTFNILQTTSPSAEEITEKMDSAKVSFETLAEGLATHPSETIQGLVQDFIGFGLKVVAAIIIYCIGAWVIKRIKKAIVKVCVKKKSDQTLITFVSSLVSITLTIVLITIVIGTLGINTTSIAALLASAGVAIGMAMSGTVQNFAGGVMIMVFKPFKAGDYIEAQGYIGTVSDVSIVSTSLKTLDNKVIIIPNGTLFNGVINNYSMQTHRMIMIDVSVEYGTDAQACIDKLLEIVKAEPRVLDSQTSSHPDPLVAVSALADSSVNFTVRAWVKTSDYTSTLFDLNKAIYTELPKAGFNFPFPQLDVHVVEKK